MLLVEWLSNSLALSRERHNTCHLNAPNLFPGSPIVLLAPFPMVTAFEIYEPNVISTPGNALPLEDTDSLLFFA